LPSWAALAAADIATEHRRCQRLHQRWFTGNRVVSWRWRRDGSQRRVLTVVV